MNTPPRGTRIESCDFIVLIGDPWFFLFVSFCLASRVEWEWWALSISFVWHVACDVWLPGALFFWGVLFYFSNYRVCVDFSGSFYFFLICVPFLGSWPVTTEGVRVSWTSSTDVRKYWVEIGTAFNVKTTTTTTTTTDVKGLKITTGLLRLILCGCVCLKKNQNAPRPSEHPPVRGENDKTFRWDHRLQR